MTSRGTMIWRERATMSRGFVIPAIRCPHCKHRLDSPDKVVDNTHYVRRRYVCPSCGHALTTEERFEQEIHTITLDQWLV